MHLFKCNVLTTRSAQVGMPLWHEDCNSSNLRCIFSLQNIKKEVRDYFYVIAGQIPILVILQNTWSKVAEAN